MLEDFTDVQYAHHEFGEKYAPLSEYVKNMVKVTKNFISRQNSHGQTLLHLAIESGNVDKIDFCLHQIDEHYTPEEIAELVSIEDENNETIFDYLLSRDSKRKIDSNLRSPFGEFNCKIFNCLLSKMSLKALTNFLKRNDGKRNVMFHILIANNWNKIFELIENFIDAKGEYDEMMNVLFNLKDDKGLSALHVAMIECNHGAVDAITKFILTTLDEKRLLDYFMDTDEKGWTTYHHAAKYDRIAILKTIDLFDKQTQLRILKTTEKLGKIILQIATDAKSHNAFRVILAAYSEIFGDGCSKFTMEDMPLDETFFDSFDDESLEIFFSFFENMGAKDCGFTHHLSELLKKSSIIFSFHNWCKFLLPFVKKLDGHHLFEMLNVVNENNNLNVFLSLLHLRDESNDLFHEELFDLMLKKRDNSNMTIFVDLLTFCKETSIAVSKYERPQKLKSLCGNFLHLASSYLNSAKAVDLFLELFKLLPMEKQFNALKQLNEVYEPAMLEALNWVSWRNSLVGRELSNFVIDNFPTEKSMELFFVMTNKNKENAFNLILQMKDDDLFEKALSLLRSVALEKQMQLLSLSAKRHFTILHKVVSLEEEKFFSPVWEIFMKLSDSFKEQIYQLICTRSDSNGTILHKTARRLEFYYNAAVKILEFISKFDCEKQIHFLTIKDASSMTALRRALETGNKEFFSLIVDHVSKKFSIEALSKFLKLEKENLVLASRNKEFVQLLGPLVKSCYSGKNLLEM